MRLIDHARMENPQFPSGIPCIVADEIARQVRRHHQRKHGRELADYYLLKVRSVHGAQDIDPVGRPARSSRRWREKRKAGVFTDFAEPEREEQPL